MKKITGLFLALLFALAPAAFSGDVTVYENGTRKGNVRKFDFTNGPAVTVSGGKATVSGSTAAFTSGTITGTTQTANLVGSIVTKTTTGSLSAAEVTQTTVVNTGASGAIVLTLPTPAVGMEFTVYLTASQDVDINPANGTQILVLTDAAGDAISSAATAGNRIVLRAISATQWIALETSGTWTDVN